MRPSGARRGRRTPRPAPAPRNAAPTPTPSSRWLATPSSRKGKWTRHPCRCCATDARQCPRFSRAETRSRREMFRCCAAEARQTVGAASARPRSKATRGDIANFPFHVEGVDCDQREQDGVGERRAPRSAMPPQLLPRQAVGLPPLPQGRGSGRATPVAAMHRKPGHAAQQCRASVAQKRNCQTRRALPSAGNGLPATNIRRNATHGFSRLLFQGVFWYITSFQFLER